MNFETSKNLSGVGAILTFIGPITSPFATIFVGGAVAFVGLILLLIGLRGLAEYYHEGGIFNNALYSAITAVTGFLAFAAIAIVAVFDFFSELGINLTIGNFSDWSTQLSNIDWQSINMSVFGKFVGFLFLDIVVFFVFILITAVLLRKSLGILSAKTGVGLFGTTGTVLLVGAALIIAFGFGLLIIWISTLLLAIAFFQIRSPPPQAEMVQTANPTQV